VLASPATLFPIEPAEQIRYTNLKAHTGDMIFRGENPPNGAIIDYWLGGASKVEIEIRDAGGALVQQLRPTSSRGINRVTWNLRHADLPVRAGSDEDGGGGGGNLPGPYVRPGNYTVTLNAGSAVQSQRVEVREDPRIRVAPIDHQAWHDALMSIAATIREAAPANERVQKDSTVSADVKRQWRELMARLTGLYGEIGRWTGRPNADQVSETRFYLDTARTLMVALK
jgi:hypothetical protein